VTWRKLNKIYGNNTSSWNECWIMRISYSKHASCVRRTRAALKGFNASLIWRLKLIAVSYSWQTTNARESSSKPTIPTARRKRKISQLPFLPVVISWGMEQKHEVNFLWSFKKLWQSLRLEVMKSVGFAVHSYHPRHVAVLHTIPYPSSWRLINQSKRLRRENLMEMAVSSDIIPADFP
jgi:hypothetical protein